MENAVNFMIQKPDSGVRNLKTQLKWVCKDTVIDLSTPKIMGIVNVTPDSFSDGGLFYRTEAAIEQARKLVKDGADIIDIGGESTRPGSEPVDEKEELRRVIPVIETLSGDGIIVSIDTCKPAVMKEASMAGAKIINDVCALREEGAMEVAQRSGCGLCLMHMKGTPKTMQLEIGYSNLLEDIKNFFKARLRAMEEVGIPMDRIVLDPGFGFGKTVSQNFELVNRAEAFTELGRPLLYGASRKSSLGVVTGIEEAKKRVISSIVVHLLAIERGVNIVRVHDVSAMKEALQIYNGVVNYKEIK